MANYTPEQFAAAVLSGLGIGQTPGAMQALVGWERAEGGHWKNTARYNPLNTTQAMPGSSATGNQGNISAYRDWGQGVEATIKTLTNGHYGGIINALKAGDATSAARAIGASPWGTQGSLVSQTITGTRAPHGTIPVPGASAGASPPASAPGAANDPVRALTASTPDAGPQTDATGLIQLASQQRQAPRGSGAAGIPAPAVLSDAYRALSSSAGPAPKKDISALIDAARTPGQAAANVAQQASPLVADAAAPAPATAPGGGGGGANAALSWAESKVGFKETGTNSGGLASYLNQQFGMSNQPWCAMFTSAAVTKGGAPKAARTASVYEVRKQAEAGGGGYRKGFIDAAHAKAGDLILFGNDHIGMVRSVKNGKVNYVGGNQSDGVTEASVAVGGGDIVRPLYGAR